MIFYGNGKVWDARRGGVLCRFVNGQADITDRSEIAYLIKQGYDHEPIDYGDEDEEPEDDSRLDATSKEHLIEIAEEHGVEVDKRWGKTRLIQAIQEAIE